MTARDRPGPPFPAHLTTSLMLRPERPRSWGVCYEVGFNSDSASKYPQTLVVAEFAVPDVLVTSRKIGLIRQVDYQSGPWVPVKIQSVASS